PQLVERLGGEVHSSLSGSHHSTGPGQHSGVRTVLSIVKVQEKSTWKMCISSAGGAGQAPGVGSVKLFSERVADSSAELERLKSKNLKNNVLQLPLCEKTISVNIQRNPKDGLLCATSPASCCHVI
uniref:Uncharacterized protein n=1 Tax=Ursus maritimus TaxID=29073 RepID=A0A452UI98_URSMA